MTEEKKTNLSKEIDRASILMQFRVEPEKKPLNKILLGALGIIMAGLIIYFAAAGNYLAALLFWLAGIVIGFSLYDRVKNPKPAICKIRAEGVQVNTDLYPYENVKSFWIFYDPPYHRELSLRVKAPLTGGFVKIPLGDEDPVKIRETLLKFIPEKRQEEGLADTLARMVGL